MLPKCRLSKVEMILSVDYVQSKKTILAVERRKLPLARRVDKEELYKKDLRYKFPTQNLNPYERGKRKVLKGVRRRLTLLN